MLWGGVSLTVWVAHNTSNLGLAESTDLTVQALEKVETSGEQLPSPTEIADAVRPVVVTGERGESVGRVSDEASDGVSVEAEEEGDE